MDSDIKNALIEHFQQMSSSPFLFVGSGFSRRYIELEKWEELLRFFCKYLDYPYEYYVSKSNGKLQDVATQMVSDFNEFWWTSSDYQNEREMYTSVITGPSSALKISIANHIKSLSNTEISDATLKEEIDLLAKSNIDGIITTNWDIFLEKLFPKYKVYIGQEELISSSPLSIAEIYKIHGCCSRPDSMVVTTSDYDDFNKKNTYLAAKLITLFVEHPIIFLGYSLNDSNVLDLLNSIVKCLTSNGINKLKNNLIFVQRLKSDRTEGISDTIMTLEGVNLPIKSVVTDDFISIYEAIASVERKIPASILRHCKEQFYTLVKENDPRGQMSVIDWESIEDYSDIEFFAGIGVVSDRVATLGYISITADDLFFDWIDDNDKYNSNQVIKKTLPELRKGRSYLPIYKHLQNIGISSYKDYEMSDLNLETLLADGYTTYQSTAYKRAYELHAKGKTIDEIISEFEPEKVCGYIPYLSQEDIDIGLLEEFIRNNRSLIKSSYKTYYRKLICLADYVKYGWEYKSE